MKILRQLYGFRFMDFDGFLTIFFCLVIFFKISRKRITEFNSNYIPFYYRNWVEVEMLYRIYSHKISVVLLGVVTISQIRLVHLEFYRFIFKFSKDSTMFSSSVYILHIAFSEFCCALAKIAFASLLKFSES